MPSPARVLAISLVAAIVTWGPAFISPLATGFGDWQYFHHMWEAGYVAITRYGEWPLWDPYHCGGITVFANPQSQHLSPLYWLSLPLGPTLASKAFVVLHAAAGFAAMYWLARVDFGISAAGAALASIAWASSGFFASHGGGGHSAFLPFYFAPLVVILWRRALVDPRYAVGLACVMTLVLLEGGVYPFPFFVLLLACEALVAIAATRAWRPTLRAASLTLLLTVLLGAIRLLPILDELRGHPRTVGSRDGVTLTELLQMLTVRDLPWIDRSWGSGGHQFVWAEYGSYVGYGVLALAAIGLVACLRQRRYAVIVVGALFLGLTLGEHGNASPWSLVHRLPIYDSLRAPSRFSVLLTLFIALAAGMGLDLLLRRVPRKRELVAWLVVLGVAIDIAAVNVRVINRWRDPPIQTEPVHERFYLTRDIPYERNFASFPRLNVGTTGCYEAMNFSVARGLWSGDEAQARVPQGTGEVNAWGRTTTHVWADVTLSAPGRVLFNQNYAPGWHASQGEVVDDAGQLAVDAPAGRQRIELVYRPATLWPGAIAFLLGVVLCACLLRKRPE